MEAFRAASTAPALTQAPASDHSIATRPAVQDLWPPASVRHPPLLPGEHMKEILREELSVSARLRYTSASREIDSSDTYLPYVFSYTERFQAAGNPL
jgi:hypothetical protein